MFTVVNIYKQFIVVEVNFLEQMFCKAWVASLASSVFRMVR